MGNFWMDLDKRMEGKAREEKRTAEVIAAYGTAVPRTSGYSYVTTTGSAASTGSFAQGYAVTSGTAAAGTYSYVSGGDYVVISTTNPQMKVSAPVEVIEEYRSIHNLDAEKALADMLQRQIQNEMDKEINGR